MWSPRPQCQSIQFLVWAIFLLVQNDLFVHCVLMWQGHRHTVTHKTKTERSCLVFQGCYGLGLYTSAWCLASVTFPWALSLVTLGFRLLRMHMGICCSTNQQHSQGATRPTDFWRKSKNASHLQVFWTCSPRMQWAEWALPHSDSNTRPFILQSSSLAHATNVTSSASGRSLGTQSSLFEAWRHQRGL